MTLRPTFLLSFLAAAAGANAAIIFTGSTIFENFDSLPSSGNTTMNGTVGLVQPLAGSTGFDGTKIGGSGTALVLIADAGTSSSGNLYSHGAVGSSERALGSIASGTNICAFGAEIVNNSGLVMSSVTISFVREQWRSSTSVQNVLTFAYGVSGGTANATNYLTDSGMTALAALDVVGQPPVASNGSQDGNANTLAVSQSFNVTVNPGDSLFIRWQDFNDAGNDAGLSIDNFEFSAQLVPEPATFVGLGAALLLVLARRRK